jgi:hypothetical protein
MASRHTPSWVMVLHIYKSLFVPACLDNPYCSPALNHDPYHPSLLPCVLCWLGSSNGRVFRLMYIDEKRGRGREVVSFDLTIGDATHPMYKTLLHLIKTSPNAPFDFPFSISSVFANCSVSPVQFIHLI